MTKDDHLVRPVKRKRRFTDPELCALVAAVSKNLHVLTPRHRNVATLATKAAAWREVTDAVNAVSSVRRCMTEVRAKYRYFKFDTKKKRDWEKQLIQSKSERVFHYYSPKQLLVTFS